MIPETKLKVSDKVKALIQNMIFKEMKPGDKLPSEAMLSELFSASRSSIREALQALESARIVEKRNNGTFVTSQLEECFVNPLSIMIQLSMVGLPELLELRQILESEAAGYAALRATETQVRDLENMAWLMQKPNIMENIISGSMFWRESRAEKSLTVSALTIASDSLTASISPAASMVICTPAAGGYMVTMNMMMTPAIRPVTTNTASKLPSIFPRRFMFSILPMALAMVANTSGTMAVNIRFRKISPNGFRTVAFSPITRPIIEPMIIEEISKIGNL